MAEASALMEHCIKCSICQTACPVARRQPDFPGPKYAGPDLARLFGRGLDATGVDWCSNCQRCKLACPHGVATTKLINDNKAASLKTKKHYWRDLLFGYPHLLGTLGTTFSPLVNPALTSSLGRAMTGGVLGLTSDSSLPRYAAQSFQRWSRGIESSGGHRVVFFVGCYTNFNAPEIGKALVALLKLLDIDAVVPEQVCCGVPLISNGFKDRAISLFKQNLKTLLPYVREGCEVVCACPTCGLALKEVYPEEMGTADALRLAGATYDYAEYLQLHAESLAAHFHPLRLRLAYHQPCHALAQGMGMPSLSLLSLIPGISAQLVEGCCGLSGTFGFKKEKGETSKAIGQPLFEAVSSINPDTVVTDCGTCAIQFVSRGGMKARHPLMVLQEAASAG